MTAPTPAQPQAAPPMPAAVRRTLLNGIEIMEEEYGRTVDTIEARAWLLAQVVDNKPV